MKSTPTPTPTREEEYEFIKAELTSDLEGMTMRISSKLKGNPRTSRVEFEEDVALYTDDEIRGTARDLLHLSDAEMAIVEIVYL